MDGSDEWLLSTANHNKQIAKLFKIKLHGWETGKERPVKGPSIQVRPTIVDKACVSIKNHQTRIISKDKLSELHGVAGFFTEKVNHNVRIQFVDLTLMLFDNVR